jgi:hypothetical protein
VISRTEVGTPEKGAGATGIDGYFAVARQGDGAWWWWDALGAFHVSVERRVVRVFLEPGADEHDVGIVLLGPIAAFLFCQLGYPTLHASAVVMDRGAVAFLGPTGKGKSTLAAAFLRRGAALLTDDILPLCVEPDGVYGLPGPPLMKLWQPTAEHTLGLPAEGLPNVTSSIDKKLLVINGQYPLAQAPAPLRALYVLNRREPSSGATDQIQSQFISKREAMAVLLAQISYTAFPTPAETASFLPLFVRLASQVPIRVLSYPSRFDWQDMVVEQVERDLETS